jgi:hypothetical protein
VVGAFCPHLLLSMIRRMAILRMEGSLLTRGRLLLSMMVSLGIEEEWDNNRIATLGMLALEAQRLFQEALDDEGGIGGGWSARKTMTTTRS